MVVANRYTHGRSLILELRKAPVAFINSQRGLLTKTRIDEAKNRGLSLATHLRCPEELPSTATSIEARPKQFSVRRVAGSRRCRKNSLMFEGRFPSMEGGWRGGERSFLLVVSAVDVDVDVDVSYLY